MPRATTKVDTWLKARNVQSSALSEDEKSLYDARTYLPIAAYKSEGDHLLVTLGVTSDGHQQFINGRTNWYVYRPAVELLRDGQPISLSTGGPSSAKGGATADTKFEVRLKVDTFFKATPEQSSS